MSRGSRNSPFQEDRLLLEKRAFNLPLRARMIKGVREFFIGRNYLEVETPLLIRAPAPEAHIDPVQVGDRFLHTSPELCMMSVFWPRVFQEYFKSPIASGKVSGAEMHLPEFSLLEWYRTETDYLGLMAECELLFHRLAHALNGSAQIRFRNQTVSFDDAWERITVRKAFKQWSPVSLEEALAKGDFDQVMVENIEPNLGLKTPTFLYDYPARLAALARLKPENPAVAERFEVYVAGIELANGFSELNDSEEQRHRFENEIKARTSLGKPAPPMPETFLKALENMPEASGIALGLDRLAMVFADARSIDEVVAFSPEAV